MTEKLGIGQQLESEELSKAPLDIQLEIINGVEELYTQDSVLGDSFVKPAELTDVQLETAIPWYLTVATNRGEWYLEAQSENNVFRELNDDVGISETRAKRAIELVRAQSIIDVGYVQRSKGKDMVANLIITDKGRDAVEQLTLFQPNTIKVIESAIIYHKKNVAQAIWEEVNAERTLLDEQPKEFDERDLDTVQAVGNYIGELRREQHDLLLSLDPKAAQQMRNVPTGHFAAA